MKSDSKNDEIILDRVRVLKFEKGTNLSIPFTIFKCRT